MFKSKSKQKILLRSRDETLEVVELGLVLGSVALEGFLESAEGRRLLNEGEKCCKGDWEA